MPKNLAPQIVLGTSVIVLLALALLHILSPEFDPSWRMVSEYANGKYEWVLTLMFFAWAISSWALAYAIWSEVKTIAGKIGLYVLILAGIGETMGGLFNINHPLHGLSAFFGILGLPIAAMLISISLSRTEGWSFARRSLLWTANLTWISVILMGSSFGIFISTFMQAGGDMSSGVVPVTLPDGVIALVGWANRLLIVVYCIWVINTASLAKKTLNKFISKRK